MRLRPPAACVALTLLFTFAGCRPGGQPHEVRLSGEALGTTWAVTVASPTPIDPALLAALREVVVKTLDRVDRAMSTWRDDSELVRFNRRAGPQPFPLSAETRRVVVAALELARQTGGAFDPTVGPLIALWRFGPEAAAAEPTAAELERVRARVGWRHLAWDEAGRLVSRLPGVELDLSAIAKGYAVDAIAVEVARARPSGALVEVGGEVRAFGANRHGEPWRVGIEDPVAAGRRLETVVELTDRALATSGDYRLVRLVQGERRSHVLDPRSGRPVQTGIASASVIAPTCMEADAVATALMVLGPDEAIAWVDERPWLEALLLLRQGDRIVARRASSRWSPRGQPAP